MKMKKRNNSGFTLVELIIVVAIIAVLAAVLAPQYIRYVERSRQSNDLQIATNLMRATTVEVTDLSATQHQADLYAVHWRTDRQHGSHGNEPQFDNSTFAVLAYDRAAGGGYTSGTADTNLRNSISAVMGWVDATGIYNDSHELVTNAMSQVGQDTRFLFYLDARTGQIYVDEGLSEEWVTEIGVDGALVQGINNIP